MIKKSLRKKLWKVNLLSKDIPNSRKNVPSYLSNRENKLVRAKLLNENSFKWVVYRGLEDELHRFIEYDWDGSIVEYKIHQDNIRVYNENLVIRNPEVYRYSTESENGKREMEIINKSGFIRETSI
ncbi:MAG: hypothetical protein AABW83_00775 [Nanoarchaeota archaeon]